MPKAPNLPFHNGPLELWFRNGLIRLTPLLRRISLEGQHSTLRTSPARRIKLGF
jgi:hypothetical protein